MSLSIPTWNPFKLWRNAPKLKMQITIYLHNQESREGVRLVSCFAITNGNKTESGGWNHTHQYPRVRIKDTQTFTTRSLRTNLHRISPHTIFNSKSFKPRNFNKRNRFPINNTSGCFVTKFNWWLLNLEIPWLVKARSNAPTIPTYYGRRSPLPQIP